MYSHIARITALALVLLAFPIHRSVAQQEYVALITDLEGSTLVARADQSPFRKAVWGMQLFEGDRVKTLDASKVSLLFANNSLIVLGAGSELTISAGPGASSEEQVRTAGEDLYGAMADLTLRGSKRNVRALAGLRGDANDRPIRLISPINTKLKTTRPTFVWRSALTFDTIEIRVYGADGLVWSREVDGGRLAYPEDEPPLAWGGSYFWEIEATSLLDTETSEKAGFSLLSEDEANEVESEEKEIRRLLGGDENSSGYHLALSALYVREGLLEAAIASVASIAEQHPEAILPHEILGGLYNDVGLKEIAIAELRHAVELSRRN